MSRPGTKAEDKNNADWADAYADWAKANAKDKAKNNADWADAYADWAKANADLAIVADEQDRSLDGGAK